MINNNLSRERKINRLYTWKLLEVNDLMSQRDSREGETPIVYDQKLPIEKIRAGLTKGMVVGVKAYYQFLDDYSEEAELKLAEGELMDFGFLRALRLRDPPNKNLIHIIHDESLIISEDLRKIVDPILRRLSFSQPERTPNFYDKPTADYDALFKKATLEVVNAEDMSVIRTQAVRHGREARRILELIRPYGLTRSEYVTLMTLSRSIEDLAKDPRVYKE